MPRMTGARWLAEAFKAYGVTHVFFVPTILCRTLAEMEERTEIKRVLTHGEKAAAYMADGYARASRRVGVCMAQTVGAANMMAGLRDPYMAGTPLLAITGGRTSMTKYRGVYQEIEDYPLYEPVTKFNATVEDVRRFPDLVRQAFRVATTGGPRPVHLELEGTQGDVEYQEADLDLLFEPRFGAVPPFRPEPEMEHVRELARVLEGAKKPVIVAGGGVRYSGAGREVVELAEKLTLPVATSLNGKGTIPGTHPLSAGVVGRYSRKSANRAVLASDLVFYIGSRAEGMVTHGWTVPPPGKPCVQLDIDPAMLGRNYPLKAALCGDAKVSLKKLIEVAKPSSSAAREAWVKEVQGYVREWREEFGGLMSSDAVPIRPERVCKEITEWLPPDGVLVSDTGHAGMWTGGMVDLTRPTQDYIRCAGSLGWGLPGALGVKCALPERPVLLFCGDAGFWYHIGELETAVRCHINLVALVNNNGSQNQEKRIFDKAYGGKQTKKALELWTFNKVNFAKVAESMGALGIRVEKPGEIRGALERAFASGRPTVVDVVTDWEAYAPLPYTG